MKFSEQWLRQWVSPALDIQAIADQITMAGLEVDSVEAVAPAFSDVVIARVDTLEQHPDADKLRICQVEDGESRWQVVCGAPNVAAGQRVALARVGAVLPGGLKIKKAKLRGVESHGMLCGASELGLEEQDSSGIMVLPEDAPIGTALRDWMGLDDSVVDVDLTPNRGDCLSLRGLAREVGVLNRLAVQEPELSAVQAHSERTFPIRIDAFDACPRLVTRVVEGVDAAAPTPLWMQERLRRSGVRSIDLIVDVTNYVMLELGQPLHAYDLDQLDGYLCVRMANEGERLTLLDEQELALRADTLVIGDAKGPLGIAGIMGGKHSGVTASTRNVLLEAAFFTPLAMAGKARSYGLHTDASQRFERGVDIALQELAIERATALLVELAGGRPGPLATLADETKLPSRDDVLLDIDRVERLLGVALDAGEIEDILMRLGFSLSAESEGRWRVAVPSWRFDVTQPADLIEELARVHGYDRLPVHYPSAHLAPVPRPEARRSKALLRDQLIARGYQEAITYSFVAPELQARLLPDAVAPSLANPISVDMSVMRAGLWPGLIKALGHNLNRQQSRVRMFEIGMVFEGQCGESLIQAQRVGGLVCGARDPEGWNARREAVDFFDLKGDVESLLALGGDAANWRFESAEHPALHPGQSARILRRIEGEERTAGWIGALHPGLRAALGIKVEVFLFELDLGLLQAGTLPQFSSLSRFPEVRRDLALVADQALPVASLLEAIRSSAGEWLSDLRLFDVYQGKGVEEGHKSLALGLTWQHPSRTLNDEEIEGFVKAVVEGVEQRFAVTLRR
ncbi:phenylalanine--tRNA ligase subunit beta [Halotalea alkalilenta]|uniref:phenylalanine--tRNA ligase subunit beta n=1 Tax=Halotalea alkalilenta TaxID=376489 RepID=UPI000488300C|nr:phenylalanine--tRNA ligase subunit beta [Halotalea alkalilenta]